jgi:hypothetical protein
MKAITFFILLSFAALKSSAQQNTLEQTLSASACKYLDKINLDTVVTQEQKKNALSQVFAQATRDNEQMLKKDKRFKGLYTYAQGKKIGLWIGQFVVPIMVKNCPKFLTLMSR